MGRQLRPETPTQPLSLCLRLTARPGLYPRSAPPAPSSFSSCLSNYRGFCIVVAGHLSRSGPHPRRQPPQDRGLSPSRPDPHARSCAAGRDGCPKPGGRALAVPSAQTDPSPTRGHPHGRGRVTRGWGGYTWPQPRQPAPPPPALPHVSSRLEKLKK